jgi:hypothetical protein
MNELAVECGDESPFSIPSLVLAKPRGTVAHSDIGR